PRLRCMPQAFCLTREHTAAGENEPAGRRPDSLDKAVSLGARMIGCDAGSTDPGPGPLATGTCMFSAAAVKRDTEIMMSRAIKAGIPLIVGSAGTSGSDAGLAWMVD